MTEETVSLLTQLTTDNPGLNITTQKAPVIAIASNPSAGVSINHIKK